VPYTFVYGITDAEAADMPRTAKVFMTNRSQAVRLPKEYQFSTSEVFIRKEGDDVIPLAAAPRLQAYLSTPLSHRCRS
jgi:antitoxin VapB